MKSPLVLIIIFFCAVLFILTFTFLMAKASSGEPEAQSPRFTVTYKVHWPDGTKEYRDSAVNEPILYSREGTNYLSEFDGEIRGRILFSTTAPIEVVEVVEIE